MPSGEQPTGPLDFAFDETADSRRLKLLNIVDEHTREALAMDVDRSITGDDVGYIPFDPDAASLFYQLVSSRYEQRSLIVSSNKTFSAWAEIFGDAVAVEAMVDRLVHHSHILTLKGDSYRLKDKHKQLATTNDTH